MEPNVSADPLISFSPDDIENGANAMKKASSSLNDGDSSTDRRLGECALTVHESQLTKQTASKPEPNLKKYFILQWARHKIDDDWSLKCEAIHGTERCYSIPMRQQPLHIEAHCYLNFDSVAEMYGCTRFRNEFESLLPKKEDQLTHLIKIVTKGSSEKSKIKMAGIQNEFAMYQKIEEARSSLSVHDDYAIPRCYGLYETSESLILLLDYPGKQLSGDSFSGIPPEEKMKLYRALAFLHSIGIHQNWISPRHIAKYPNGTYELARFYYSYVHSCPEYPSRIFEPTLFPLFYCEELDHARQNLRKNSISCTKITKRKRK